MSFLSRLIIFSVVIFSFLPVKSFTQELYICVWRNPERTMTRIFKEAKDYRTITKKITSSQLEIIEKRLGSKLLPGQRETYQYYEMLDATGAVLGYIIAASQKGEYGAIEFVFGLDGEKKINGIYIQRARERDKEFKKEEFLKQFITKSIKDIDKLEIIEPSTEKRGEGIKAKKTVGTKSVLLGIKKELVAFDKLVQR